MSSSPQVDVSPSLAGAVIEDEFLILDDEDANPTQAKPESANSSSADKAAKSSAGIGSLGSAFSSIQRMLGSGVSKIRSSIAAVSEKRAAKATPVDELVLDDGSLEDVTPLGRENSDSADFM